MCARACIIFSSTASLCLPEGIPLLSRCRLLLRVSKCSRRYEGLLQQPSSKDSQSWVHHHPRARCCCWPVLPGGYSMAMSVPGRTEGSYVWGTLGCLGNLGWASKQWQWSCLEFRWFCRRCHSSKGDIPDGKINRTTLFSRKLKFWLWFRKLHFTKIFPISFLTNVYSSSPPAPCLWSVCLSLFAVQRLFEAFSLLSYPVP